MGITNNGMFTWQAAKTKKEKMIGLDVQLSLMLWTDNPPRRTYSPTFTIMDIDSETPTKELSIKRSDSPPGSKPYSACMDYLFDNGGVYNHTRDMAFQVDNSDEFTSPSSDAVSGWEVTIACSGSTTANISGDRKNITISEMGVNLVQADNQGMGLVALSEVQRMRNRDAGMSGDQATNVVGLYLGSGNTPGHVVMGGYDRAFIDQTQGSTVYRKKQSRDGQFEVQLVGVTYIPESTDEKGISKERALTNEVAILMDKTQLRLSFNSPTIVIPESILNNLLPHLGAPLYNKELNGYVYEASAKSDYSLKFTLANSSSGNFVDITIPATSLLTRETTNDNPLTNTVTESGREYLLLAPLRSSSGNIGFLGRAFLKHTYMVDDSFLGKFFMSAVNTTAVKGGASSLITGSTGLMDAARVNASPSPVPSAPVATSDSVIGHTSKTPLVGPLLGGLIGGIAILWLVFLFFYLRRRRARSQFDSVDDGDDVDGDKALEHGIATIFGSAGKRGMRGNNFIPKKSIVGAFSGMSKKVDMPPEAILRESKQYNTPEPMALSGILKPTSKTLALLSPMAPSLTDEAPPPPVKDEQYYRTVALAQKRFSQPLMPNIERLSDPPNRKRRSAPNPTIDNTVPYARYLRDNDFAAEIQSPHPIPTYQQLLAHHQARRQRESYIDSNSSNANDNDANTTNTSSTETATVGKIIARGQVAKIRQLSATPPHVALANTLERRASVGRVVTPGEVVIVPPSRRTSRSSRELLQSPRKSNSPAGSSHHSREASTEGASVGHRRGKSAPSDLGFPLSPPGLPPSRAQDDIFVGGVRMIAGRTVGPSAIIRRVPVPNSPKLVEEDSVPPSFLEASASEDGISSSSSTVLPRKSYLMKRNISDSSKEEAPSPVSPLSERGDGDNHFLGGRGRDTLVSPVSPQTPPPYDRRFS